MKTPTFVLASLSDAPVFAAAGEVLLPGFELAALGRCLNAGPLVWVPPRTHPDAAALAELFAWLEDDAGAGSVAFARRRFRCDRGEIALPDRVVALRGGEVRLRQGRLAPGGVRPHRSVRLAQPWWVESPGDLALHLEAIDQESDGQARLRQACGEAAHWTELVWPLLRGLPALLPASGLRRQLLTRLLLEGYRDVLASVKLKELELSAAGAK